MQGLALRDALVLGAALSLNNLAAGVDAGISDIPPLATTLLAGALSLACIGGARGADCRSADASAAAQHH